MRKLLALGAVAGLAATTYRVNEASAAGDAGAAAPDVNKTSTDDGGDAGVADAAPDALPVVFDPESRYGVVDPLPPPQPGGCGCRKNPDYTSRR